MVQCGMPDDESTNQCLNHELCGGSPNDDNDEYFKHFDHCINCRMIFGKTLEFGERDESCPICFEHGRMMKFPACSHWFCVSCSRDILLWQEERYHVNPCLYGCPPCPNGCENPNTGFQCYCEDYIELIEHWEEMNPEEAERWNAAADDSVNNNGYDTQSYYASRKCPLCRARF